MASHIGRRKFLATLGGAAAAWPHAARTQQPAMPVIGFLNSLSPNNLAQLTLENFLQGLKEAGFVDGKNVTIEYRWAEGHYDRLPALAADLVHRQVAVIATSGATPALAAKAATGRTPIVFDVGEDPVKLGLVANLARPGGNATGINFFANEVVAKRLRLLHEMVPKVVRVAVFVNPGNASVTTTTIRDVQEAASTIGLKTQIYNATTIGEINAAFANFARELPDALFVAGDAFLISRAVQFITLTARDRIPATYPIRDFVAAGGLMSYGTDLPDALRQVGVYTGKILKGAKPADLPTLQSTRFQFVINIQTAQALGIEVPPGLLAIADEVIE